MLLQVERKVSLNIDRQRVKVNGGQSFIHTELDAINGHHYFAKRSEILQFIHKKHSTVFSPK